MAVPNCETTNADSIIATTHPAVTRCDSRSSDASSRRTAGPSRSAKSVTMAVDTDARPDEVVDIVAARIPDVSSPDRPSHGP